jgi:CubicO group peptidase (beta-lactamase class C family)
MSGLWFTVDFDNVYFSTARSMARYGLLIQNKCIWNTDTLLYDTAYINQMTNTSQALNYSYGYLWWLNGKQSYMVPTLQTVFPGSYAPLAPNDMFSGLGKNGQIVSISRSQGLVFVRMGDSPNSPASEVTTLFCNQIWEKINNLACNPSSTNTTVGETSELRVFPNPANESFQIELRKENFSIRIFNMTGKIVYQKNDVNEITTIRNEILSDGIYTIQINIENGKNIFSRIVVIR